MADGKVMQKYFPPDFDPEALKKNRDVMWALRKARGGKRQRGPRMMEMRMMFPFTLQCHNCRDFVYVGTKFNSKVEKIRDEDYLGIPIWRFYGRCPHCRHQLVMKTDPKNIDYVMESGGTRTSDPNRDASLAEAALKEAQQEAAEGDAVKALEIKSYSTAEELKTIEQLDELRRINKRFMSMPDKLSEAALQKLEERDEDRQEELDHEEMEWARRQFRKREFDSSDSSDEDDHPKSGDGPTRQPPPGGVSPSGQKSDEEQSESDESEEESEPERMQRKSPAQLKTSARPQFIKKSLAEEELREAAPPSQKTLSNSHSRMFVSSAADLGVEVQRNVPSGHIDKTDADLDELLLTLAEESIEDYAPSSKRRH